MRTWSRRPILEPRFRPVATWVVMPLVIVAGTMCAAAVMVKVPQLRDEINGRKEAGRVRRLRQPDSAGNSRPATPPSRRVALTTTGTRTHTTLKPAASAESRAAAAKPAPAVEEDPVTRALRTIRECQARVGGRHRPVDRNLHILLLEDRVALGVSDGRGGVVPIPIGR